MPHRIPNFLHAQSILPAYFHEAPKPIHRVPDNIPSIGNRTPSIRSASSKASKDRTTKMPDSALKRVSLGWFPQKLRKVSSKSTLDHVGANADIVMESPPLVFYGSPSQSTGALFSGQLKLIVTDDSLEILDYTMSLALETTKKRPFRETCKECTFESKELTNWTFLKGPQRISKGEHSFPFSWLLKGSLPASVDGSLCKIEYVLHVVVNTKTGENIIFDKILPVKRALLTSDLPRSSLRVFPPTDLTAAVELPQLIYPIGEAMAHLKLNKIIFEKPDIKSQSQWRLQKMLWQIQETFTVISPACQRHTAKVLSKAADMPRIENKYTDVRTIGSGEMSSGWKSDYSSAESANVEIEFPFFIRPDAHAICDCKTEDGTEVTHRLVVELVVAEEIAPIHKPTHGMPSGAARRLRMHFILTVTDRSGLGISWDEEQPPIYEDVPRSPPGYQLAEIFDYVGSPIQTNALPPVPDYEPLP